MPSLYYPAGPAVVPEDLTGLSGSYKLRATLSIVSILLFFLLYLGLVAATGFLLYQAIIAPFVVSLMGIVLKGGLIFGAGMLFFFTVKFVFKLRRPDMKNRIEVDRDREPELWAFVERVCIETDVSMPKAIYVDPEINAYVRYTNFWLSLFFPVGKELTIGLGLVNTLKLAEFKAVVAHEFGHFSQRSMVIGSYVATANTIIHDMIFTRDRWDETLDRWRRLDFRIAIFAWIVTGFAWIVRQILRLFYSFLNLMHASLSREMEFNADKVAVRAAGSDAIISALWSLENRQHHWTGTVNNAYLAANKGMYTRNLYDHHSRADERHAETHARQIAELPSDERGGRRYFAGSDVSSIPMYASHPPNDLREANAKVPYVPCEGDDRSPWKIFSDPAIIQQEMTTLVYNLYLEKSPDAFAAPEEFETFVLAESEGDVMSEDYAGTFQTRPLYFPDPAVLESSQMNEMLIADGFNYLDMAIKALMKQVEEVNAEMVKVQKIADRSVPEKEYVRNGVTYRKKELAVAFESLQKEHTRLHDEEIRGWDADFCALHLRLARTAGTVESLGDIYRQYALVYELQAGSAGILELISQVVANLQEEEVFEEDIERADRVIAEGLERLNESIASLAEVTFVPLPNIETPDELREAVIEKGRFAIPNGSILGDGHLGDIVQSLNTGLAHTGRILQKNLVLLLDAHKGLREEFEATTE